MSSLKKYLLNLNFFSSSDDGHQQEDHQHLRLNVICTRVCIVFIIMILVCTGLVLFLTKQTVLTVVRNPTKEEFEKLHEDAKCSCSQISIPYGKFTTLNASFHQVCSSDFVTDRWFKAINFDQNTTYFSRVDFRTYGSAQFQALAGFCRLSKASNEQSISSFYSNILLSSEVLSDKVFQSQTQSSIDQFQLKAPNAFRSQRRLINQMIGNNKIISALRTNFFYYPTTRPSGTLFIHLQAAYPQANGSRCFCGMDLCNAYQSGFYGAFAESTPSYFKSTVWTLPGISSGCLPVESISLSTLECFYNQTCLNKLISYIPTNESFQAMNMLDSTLYKPDSTIESMINNLMIEDWITNISYEKYYSECAPSLCTYYSIARRSFVFILTELISLLASLVLILGIVFSLTIRVIQNLQDKTPKPKISFCVRLHQWRVLVQQKLVDLNMFKKNSSTNREIDYQRCATRFYAILIIILMATITRYNATKISVQSKTIYSPTLSQYIKLQQEYPRTLSCSCSSVSMLYSTFITIQTQYHQLCSSYLISKEWLQYIRQIGSTEVFDTHDLRANFPYQFSSLSMFCEQAKQTVDEASQIFLQTDFISSQVISQQSFQVQINTLIEDWKLTTINTFIRTIQLARATTQGNQLSNLLNSFINMDNISKEISTPSLLYPSCDCALSPSCRRSVGFFGFNASSGLNYELYSVPKFYTGCYLIESLFASTLECFYNILCMWKMSSYLSSAEVFNYDLLDAKSNTPNETIEAIINRLMIDKWTANISFTSYYNRCAPSSCTYQYEDRSNLYTVISGIGLIYGGLSLGLQFVILIGLSFIYIIIQNGTFCYNVLQIVKRIFICNTEHRVADRLHFMLVVTTVSILYMCSAFAPQITNVTTANPTLSMYENLIKQSLNSIECPCSKISIKYRTFLKITPSFHQLCSSNLISNLTSSYFYNTYTRARSVPSSDFLYSASAQFQLLASFCDLSQETVYNSLVEQGTSDFISMQLLSSTALNNQIRGTINDFQITMPKSFVNTLSLIREITGANMLLNTLSTSWMIETPSVMIDGWVLHNKPLSYGGCSCALSSKCVSSSRGMLVGCYPLESILQSTLECFYNRNCLDQLFGGIKGRNISALTSSRFPVDTKVESIVNELMIENLTSSISHELYFNQCAPLSCVYSYVDNNNVIEAITALIGLYGGLVIICRSIAILIAKCILYRKNRVTAVTEPEVLE